MEMLVTKKNSNIWEKIEHYATIRLPPLCCNGDFNAVSSLKDKYGGSQRMSNNNRSFRGLL
jgi:hypothetical protein